MADSVKWIKMTTDLFNNRKIKQIRKMPEGDAIIGVWLQILCLAGDINNGGLVYFSQDIPYTDEMLATEFERPNNIIRLALQTFEAFRMIYLTDDVICVSNWEKYQSVDGLEKIRENNRLRQQRFRENQKLLIASNVCQYCGKPATGYDHVVATSKGGMDTEDNKVYCCKECNVIKNDKLLVDFLNANRDRIRDDIVLTNPILSKKVMLHNVTGRYEVTDSSISISNSISNSNKDLKDNKETKSKYGEFQNVLLTTNEYEKLKEKFPHDYQDRIEDLSIYMDSKGKTYKNHYATILNWSRMEEKGKRSSNPFKEVYLQEEKNEQKRNSLLNGGNQNSLPRILPPVE